MEFEVDYLDEFKEKQEQRGRTGFVIQYKYLEAMALLNDEERSEFLLAMYEYDLKGKLPELSKRVRAVVKTLKYDIDKTRDVWERNNRNGRAKQPKDELGATNNSCGGLTASSDASGSSNNDDVNVNNAPQSASGGTARSLNDISVKPAGTANEERAAGTGGSPDSGDMPCIGENGRARQDFIPPTLKQVKEFAKANNLKLDAEAFIDYYEANGWMIGVNKMNNWRAALSRWVRNSKITAIGSKNQKPGFAQREFDEEKEREKRFRAMLKEGERIAKLEAAKENGG